MLASTPSANTNCSGRQRWRIPEADVARVTTPATPDTSPPSKGRMTMRVATTAAALWVVSAVHAGQPSAQSGAADPVAADLAVFRTQFLARDASFSAEVREQAERRLAALEKNRGPLSVLQVHLELARIAALADNGHTHVVIGRMAEAYGRIPVRVLPMGNDMVVVRAHQAHADLLGSRVVAIGTAPIARVQEEARALWGGVERFRDQFAYSLIESPAWLHASGLIGTPTSATYVFETRDGRRIERILEGEPPSSMRPTSPPGRTMAPALLPTEGGAWRTVLAPEKAPWALQAFDDPFRWRLAPDVEGLVIQMRRNADAGDRTIAQALTAFRAALTQHRPRNLVLDFRWNGGGDLNTTRDFMKALPELVAGRIVVLTSPLTFSAAISSVGYLKQAAPNRVVIVGEPVGDRLVFFAEGRPVELPQSRLLVALATERHDYQGGCRTVTDCHRAVVRHPIEVSSLAPDVPVSWSVDAYASGRDPFMDAAVRVLQSAAPQVVSGWSDDSRRAPPSTDTNGSGRYR